MPKAACMLRHRPKVRGWPSVEPGVYIGAGRSPKVQVLGYTRHAEARGRMGIRGQRLEVPELPVDRKTATQTYGRSVSAHPIARGVRKCYEFRLGVLGPVRVVCAPFEYPCVFRHLLDEIHKGGDPRYQNGGPSIPNSPVDFGFFHYLPKYRLENNRVWQYQP